MKGKTVIAIVGVIGAGASVVLLLKGGGGTKTVLLPSLGGVGGNVNPIGTTPSTGTTPSPKPSTGTTPSAGGGPIGNAPAPRVAVDDVIRIGASQLRKPLPLDLGGGLPLPPDDLGEVTFPIPKGGVWKTPAVGLTYE